MFLFLKVNYITVRKKTYWLFITARRDENSNCGKQNRTWTKEISLAPQPSPRQGSEIHIIKSKDMRQVSLIWMTINDLHNGPWHRGSSRCKKADSPKHQRFETRLIQDPIHYEKSRSWHLFPELEMLKAIWKPSNQLRGHAGAAGHWQCWS